MKKSIPLFAFLFLCSTSFLFGQNQVKIELESIEVGEMLITVPSLDIQLVSLKSLGRDDCDSKMQFNGTATIDFGQKTGSMTYRFEAQPNNHLQFDKNAFFTTMGYDFGNQVDVLFKILDADKPCRSRQDIVDINELPNENALKIRIKGNQVWLLNSQDLEMKVLGNVGEVITIRGNRYVNNSANTRRLRGRVSDNRKENNQQRGGKWNLPPDVENLGAPDIEVGEFQFIVKREKFSTRNFPNSTF